MNKQALIKKLHEIAADAQDEADTHPDHDRSMYCEGKAAAAKSIRELAEAGHFDEPKPIITEFKPGGRVRHKDQGNDYYKNMGIGVVEKMSNSGKKVFVKWPNYDKNYFRLGGPAPAYYSPTSLIKADDDQ